MRNVRVPTTAEKRDMVIKVSEKRSGVRPDTRTSMSKGFACLSEGHVNLTRTVETMSTHLDRVDRDGREHKTEIVALHNDLRILDGVVVTMQASMSVLQGFSAEKTLIAQNNYSSPREQQRRRRCYRRQGAMRSTSRPVAGRQTTEALAN